MNLLIVDDEIFAIQGILKDIDRKRLQFNEILTANSYAQAVNIFLNNKVDLLLCDIEMPYGSGLDLVEWVKENKYDTECIFLTCHDEFAFAKQAIALRCLDYVLKPVTADKINKVLDNAIHVIQGKRKDQVYKDYGKVYIDTISESEEGRDKDYLDAVESTENYIKLHINEEFSVEDLAKIVYMSSAHLSRLFKKKHGLTLNSYITKERMKLAKELLENKDMTVTMVSAKIGYNNYSYFTKQFRKHYGKTPSDYRKGIF